MISDLKYAFRTLAKSPAFTTVAIVTMALGISAATAIFSVIDGVLLHPLPYPDSENIVVLIPTNGNTGGARGATAPANDLDYVAQNDVFTYLSASRGEQFSLSDGDRPERVRGTM